MTSKKENLDIKFVEPDESICSMEDRLNYLIEDILKNPNSLIVASEVYFTDFAYDAMEQAAAFTQYATLTLQEVVKNQIVVFSAIDREGDGFVNRAIVIHQGKIVHTQEKAKLFKLGKEDIFFQPGDIKKIAPFQIDGIKIGVLICFELRFKELWSRLDSCDLIIIPSKWGIQREKHFKLLSNALAVINQCYVVALSHGDKDICSFSALFSPNGDMAKSITLKEVKKARRYIAVGNG